MLTHFWDDLCVGLIPLRILFQRLYSITNKKENVGKIFFWEDENLVWNLNWKRLFFTINMI